MGVCMCVYVCGMNFQNFFRRIESLHQRTLIRILYEFLQIESISFEEINYTEKYLEYPGLFGVLFSHTVHYTVSVCMLMNQKPQLYIAGMGMESPCGHIDFYPNGGYDQPGCSLFDMPVSLDSMVDPDSSSTAAIDTMGRHLVACSHNRGIELYIESLQEESKCHFIGHECESDEKFQDGLCFDCGLRHSALKSE